MSQLASIQEIGFNPKSLKVRFAVFNFHQSVDAIYTLLLTRRNYEHDRLVSESFIGKVCEGLKGLQNWYRVYQSLYKILFSKGIPFKYS